MKKQTMIYMQVPMLIGGILVLVIGFGHIFMPTLGYEDHIAKAMEPEVSGHFYYLGTYAICTFLLSLGFISVYFARKTPSIDTLVISSVFSMVWISRAILEFIYPTQLKIFMLQTPHDTLRFVILFLAILYSFSSIYGFANRKTLFLS